MGGYGGVMEHDEGHAPAVDWDVAADVAARFVRPGPPATRSELAELVAGLRAAATDAVAHVERITELGPVGEPPTARSNGPTPTPDVRPPLSRTLVVDRASWARANARMLAVMTSGVRTGGRDRPTARWSGGAQVGTVLSVVSSRVLGQFDPFTASLDPRTGRPGPGTLLLVAPNVLRMERTLDVVPGDFRLWVALHEQTHARQFAAAPWLAAHLRDRATALLTDLVGDDGAPGAPGARAVLARVVGAITGRASDGVEAVLSPRQREAFDELGAVMALLEGHADVMMDAVGPDVVPTVRVIRERFDARRQGTGRWDAVVRSLLGVDQKLAQYRDGAVFVRSVTSAVGTSGLNAVWSEPGTLPSAREIADPRAWVRRVHG